MILTTDAQLWTFGVNELTKIIYVFFAGSVTRRIETVNTENQRFVLVIFEHASLDFFYI